MDQLFYIWSFEHDAWWLPNENGYVEDFHAAGKYSFADAMKIVNDANYSFNTGYAETPNEAMVPCV